MSEESAREELERRESIKEAHRKGREQEQVRALTKELLVDHNRRCRACPICVDLKELLAKLEAAP
jgi:hypothetical protein